MKLGKHTLLIDGNYFLHSRLFVLPNKKGQQLLGTEDSQKGLMRKLCIDFASELRKMSKFVDQIVVTVDSKSWRKDLFPEAQYKGTRVQDDSVNWKAVFSVYVEWQQILAKQGVVIHQINGAEADDVIFGWSTQLNNEGRNCIVWSGDRDLIQLVNYNNATDAYSLWYYSSRRVLIGFEGFEDILTKSATDNMSNDDLLFDMASTTNEHDQARESITEWIRTNRVTTQEINCDDFIFTKIIQGDKSDNIRSVVTWTKTAVSSGKTMNYSITEKNANKILDKFKETEGDFTIDKFFNKDCVSLIVDIIHTTIGKSTPEEIRVRFNQNLDLMLLHFNTIPDPIQKQIYKAIETDLTIMPIVKKLTKMEVILEGTDWLQKKGTAAPGGYNPFAGLKTPETKGRVGGTITKELF
jgi:5'-3' exonuclease